MTRDTQRSKMYKWERSKATRDDHWKAGMSIEELNAYVAPIWRKERGRVGLAKAPVPEIRSSSWGQRRGLAFTSRGYISLPLWARSQWVALHELAHMLTPGDHHGPRFVGVLIGLACRYLGYDANALMESADEYGVKYSVRSIGCVPVIEQPKGIAEQVRETITEHGPMSEMDIACWLNLSYLQVRGAAMSMIRKGHARWLRNKLVLLDPVRLAA